MALVRPGPTAAGRASKDQKPAVEDVAALWMAITIFTGEAGLSSTSQIPGRRPPARPWTALAAHFSGRRRGVVLVAHFWAGAGGGRGALWQRTFRAGNGGLALVAHLWAGAGGGTLAANLSRHKWKSLFLNWKSLFLMIFPL